MQKDKIMKILSPKGMKTLKVFHLIFIMMWTVGVLMMGLLYWRPSVNSLEFLYNQTTALLIDYALVIPGAVLAVVTGIIYGVKTKWGFFRHRWLTVKWIVGVVIIIIGTFGLHPLALEIIDKASLSANEAISFPTDYFGWKLPVISCMALIQAAGLLFLIWVSVFKPWNKKNTKA